MAAEHEKAAHMPKDPACPVCVEEEGTRITHSKKDPHYGTLYMDTGMMDCISEDGCKYFLAMGLRIKGPEHKPVLVPFSYRCQIARRMRLQKLLEKRCASFRIVSFYDLLKDVW